MSTDIRPRQYALQLLAEVPLEQREAWIEANVPAEWHRLVVAQLAAFTQSVEMLTTYVLRGTSRHHRSDRLSRVPSEVRAIVQREVSARFAAERKAG